MNVKWYYRQSEVPDSVYQHLVQDRNNENGEVAAHVQFHSTQTHTESKYTYLLFNTTLLCFTNTHTPASALQPVGGYIRTSCELHFKHKPEDGVPGSPSQSHGSVLFPG